MTIPLRLYNADRESLKLPHKVALDMRGYPADILQPMFARLVSVLLVVGWVSLSAFDLLEDLKIPSGGSAYTQTDKSHAHRWSKHPSLANNIIESAVSAPTAFIPLVDPNRSPSAIHPLTSSHGVLELHKLHRVLLI